ncbi:hypothetical protein D3C76_1677040 [compost metagenome]
MEAKAFRQMGQTQINVCIVLYNEFDQLVFQLFVAGALAFIHHLTDGLQNSQQLGFNLLKRLACKQLPNQIITMRHLVLVI